MASGLARAIPRLRETHVLRDSWTKLNVAPAKIMQVNIHTKDTAITLMLGIFFFFLYIARVCPDRITYVCFKYP